MNSTKVHAILVKAVREIQGTNEFMGDMWITYCHNWNPFPSYNDGYLPHDPQHYPTSFLGQFMQHAAKHYNKRKTFEEYIKRRTAKKPRLDPRYLELELLGVYVKRIWICVGQAELDEGRQSIGGNYHEVRVRLGTSSVVHSGTAVSMFMHCLDANLFSLRLGCKLATDVQLNCLHFEGKFDNYPRPGDSPHLNRMDNVNNVFRCFGVDAGSTKRMFGKTGRFLDRRLEHFVAVGTGTKYRPRPCFDIEPGPFIEYLTKKRTKVLQDTLFVKQVSNEDRKPNGVNRWRLPIDRDVVNEMVTYYGHNDPSTVVVHLHPEGTSLIVDDTYVDDSNDLMIEW